MTEHNKMRTIFINYEYLDRNGPSAEYYELKVINGITTIKHI